MLMVGYGTCRPAGGQFTVEMSGNRAFTTLSYGGKLIKEFGDDQNEPQRGIPNNQWSVHGQSAGLGLIACL